MSPGSAGPAGDRFAKRTQLPDFQTKVFFCQSDTPLDPDGIDLARATSIMAPGRTLRGPPDLGRVMEGGIRTRFTTEVMMADRDVLRVGDLAPEFELPSSTGETVRLSDFRGKSEVVLFFYPKDHSLGCTMEACTFRDSHEAFREVGAEVIGISSDSTDSHRRFADRLRLPFVLLSDSEGSVRAQYGVPRTLGLLPGRVTYLIDREGIVRHIFSSQLQPWRHVTAALEVLDELRR
jgi:thioredoxin-dependent peroxiredoxin